MPRKTVSSRFDYGFSSFGIEVALCASRMQPGILSLVSFLFEIDPRMGVAVLFLDDDVDDGFEPCRYRNSCGRREAPPIASLGCAFLVPF